MHPFPLWKFPYPMKSSVSSRRNMVPKVLRGTFKWAFTIPKSIIISNGPLVQRIFFSPMSRWKNNKMDSNRFRTQRIWKTYHLFIWTGILCIFLGVFFWLTDEVGALCDGLGVHQQVIIYSCIVNYFFREKIKMDSDQFRTQRLWKTYHFFIWTGILCSFFFFLRFFLGGNFLRQLLKICTQINSPMRSERWVSVLRGLLPAGNNPLFYSGLLIFVKKLKWTATD